LDDAMRTLHRLVFEALESRQALDGDVSSSSFLASQSDDSQLTEPAAPLVAQDVRGDSTSWSPSWLASSRQLLASYTSERALSSRWDWLAGTQWYVPRENLLAFTTNTSLEDPTPVADQTLWNITSSADGQISGEALVKLSSRQTPIQLTMSGVVTTGGQIRIEFSFDGSSGTIGIGQMRFVEGAWRMEMQMATGSSSLLTHWAYMSQGSGGVVPDEPSELLPDESFISDEWRWLEGTRWALHDSSLFGNDTQSGVFQITNYRNGYYWGSGTGTQPFNVLGSVTPEGNVLLLVSEGTQPYSLSGQLWKTSAAAAMTLHAYDEAPSVGWAWML
jgi:hypothetical protein